jgi:hypothetical protein
MSIQEKSSLASKKQSAVYPNTSKVNTTEGINVKERSSSALAMIQTSVNIPNGQDKNNTGNHLRELHS